MLNKAGRASLAKETVNNLISHILKTNTRARDGVNRSELIRYVPGKDKLRTPPASTDHTNATTSSTSTSTFTAPTPQTITSKDALSEGEEAIDGKSTLISEPSPNKSPHVPKIRIVKSDTYDAVQTLVAENSKSKPPSGIAALNLASSYNPGGGFMNGALAQEEALCMRSTLYPSLKPSYYRMPELSAVYSPDVLVFRGSDLENLATSDWFFTDVISVAALKQPELKWNGDRTKLVYEDPRDEEVMVAKIRLIFQVMVEKGIKRIVAGALGCGAYKNPPGEVARMFRKVILGDRKRRGVEGIDEVVFAIFDEGPNLKAFREVFADVSE